MRIEVPYTTEKRGEEIAKYEGMETVDILSVALHIGLGLMKQLLIKGDTPVYMHRRQVEDLLREIRRTP
jgi:coproporphyrinogen III oxidase-like Fe-S oxidoreductase